MLASLHPSSPATSDQAVRELLDKRARASHTRYTSVSFSQRSDSPSIYSRGDISPNPMYAPVGELPPRPGHPISLTAQSMFDDAEEEDVQPPYPADFSNHGGRYLHADEDEDEDDKSFIEAPTPRPASRRDANPSQPSGPEFESPSIEKIEEDPRMSLLGPKMRFVSRAPWEAGEDDLLETEEEDAGGFSDNLSIFGGKPGNKRGRDSDKSSVKGLGLATFRSRSPGPPSAPSKKGGIGMNFGLYRHKTPEPPTDSPYGPYLSGASHSHSTILNTLSSARSSHSVTDSQSSHNLSYKTPFPRGASGPTSPSSHPPPLPSPTPYNYRAQKPSFSSHDDSSASSFRSESPTPPARFMHPYANPDLMLDTEPSPITPIPRTPRKSRDQSSEERERRPSPLRRQSESPRSSPRPVNPRSTAAGGNTFPVPHPWDIDGLDYEHESIHPFSDDQTPATTDGAISKPPYLEPRDGPMRTLISLEQARTRAQNSSRASSSTQNAGTTPRSTPSSTLVAGLGLAPGVVENGVVRGQGQRSAMVSSPHSETGAPQNQDLSYQRTRTMSSGKHMGGGGVPPVPDGDIVPVKTVKHKKSAFMKLFQSGKDKERDKEQSKETSSPARPPSRAVSTPPTTAGDQSIPPLPAALNVKRVPPPLPLSVVVTSPSIGASGSLYRAAQGPVPRPASPPRLRQASSPLPSSGDVESQYPPYQDQWSAPNERPQPAHLSPSASSAPASQTKFTALSLRPVSTMFSSNFPDLLSPTSPPSNPSTAWNLSPSDPSPTTPVLEYSRSNSMSTASDYPITPSSGKPYPGAPSIAQASSDDQTAFIAALQEQILNSRKAWQRQIWELEGQVKDLKAEVEELRNSGECESCGKAKRDGRTRAPAPQNYGVVDRPRPRMGGNTRSVFGGANDM